MIMGALACRASFRQERGMEEEPRNGPSGLGPALVLLALAALLLGGWWLFPRFSAYMARQDCVASGHVTCG